MCIIEMLRHMGALEALYVGKNILGTAMVYEMLGQSNVEVFTNRYNKRFASCL